MAFSTIILPLRAMIPSTIPPTLSQEVLSLVIPSGIPRSEPSLPETARSKLDMDERIAEDPVSWGCSLPEPGHFELAFDECVCNEQDAPNTAVLPPSLSQFELKQPHLAVPQPHLAQHGHSSPTPREPDPDLFAAEEALAHVSLPRYSEILVKLSSLPPCPPLQSTPKLLLPSGRLALSGTPATTEVTGVKSLFDNVRRPRRRSESYEDCRAAGKLPRDVAMEVIRYSKELGEKDKGTCMARIYNCLYPGLKDLVVEPTDDITLDEWEAKVRPQIQTLFVS
ncbi:hypothetical protein GE21DRAFT_5045 [Neurospora crassa]|uniref:Uncharacterized protein n=1 Tax=Neurospora crassa (strain ATCC 24698 / 74-OR23-1A / CBS 708.71 / DSM 1257 / FGSC 987) TaxID=367110 RepID=U9W3N9_NEUCR|nr:hypothetical protein NCU16704 [Neurospora crassa OR74A]ESA43446.1 hypothetical protein NCU16704 [Neurospora crassa OR74A]KHE86521.1 hypothetical protein GE21DRAFT_5045 [Neurospora crassa]|eukprot:XP_011394068.1 hypothetical protein NCU16704 [Neurospora crassa OR74A]